MSEPRFPEGAKCRYMHPEDLCVSLWGSDIVRVVGPHPRLGGMAEVVGESGHREYVRWCDLEEVADGHSKLIYDEVDLDGGRLSIASDRTHVLIDRHGISVRLSRHQALKLRDALNGLVLDALGDL